MLEQAKRYQLQNRYVFKGQLDMQTGLHIGGGKFTLSNSDSPVVLTPENIPFIPGSSFKGSLRSTVEKLVPGLPGELFSCGLIELSEEEERSARRNGQKVCSTARQRAIVKERRENSGKEADILKDSRANLCNTCQLFGSPYAASSISINDLYMSNKELSTVQRRDGVAIDRDSEKAKDRLKYDFEVVPASAAFDLEITLENASLQDLQILCVGLSEFVHGFGVIGGMRSRGLGACRLEGLTVSGLELTEVDETERNRRLKDYLIKKKFSLEEESGEVFLEKYINSIFSSDGSKE